MFEMNRGSVAVVSEEPKHHQDVADGDVSVVGHVAVAVIFSDARLGDGIPNGAFAATPAILTRRAWRGGKTHGVAAVNHPIVGVNGRDGDLRIGAEDASVTVSRDGDVSTVQCGDGLAVAVGAERRRYHVVQQNVRQLRQGKQVRLPPKALASVEVVGRCEDREGSVSAQRAKASFQHRGLEEVVDVAVDDNVHDGVGGVRTASMTWTTPLSAVRSATLTWASLMKMPASLIAL